jgi:ribonuclease BN (tRNA processing enzyme)
MDLKPSSIAAELSGYARVLLWGAMGSGKSTLAAMLASEFALRGTACACISGDPGSPAFGVPGAVCLGRWEPNGWESTDLEPVCSLDAARFRLPLIQALTRLIRRAPRHQILFDAPGVVRGVAGAEFLTGVVESAEIDAIVALELHSEAAPLQQELEALGLPVFRVLAAPEARRPARTVRDRRRTAMWDEYLKQASEHRIDLNTVALIGTPPPRDAPSAWRGRQVALVHRSDGPSGGRSAGRHWVAFGEALQLDSGALLAKLCGDPEEGQVLLIRDAVRDATGLLKTAAQPPEDTRSSPPPDMSRAYVRTPSEWRPVVRMGSAVAMLVNGVLGDPLLHIRLQHQKRSLLFDLGETNQLPARIAHQVTDVCITHGHIDHIGGFVWLLRSRIGKLPACRIYGPPGVAENIMGFLNGIHWDRIGDLSPQFEISELDEEKIRRYRVRAGDTELEIAGDGLAPDGIILRDAAFQLRVTTLDHRTPVLAFALEILRSDTKLVYATDLADTIQNRNRLKVLAGGAHTFFCEAPFCETDAEQAARTGHLTARACGEIAAAAHVERLIPFHFSRRYQNEIERVYSEVKAACPAAIVPRL